MNIPFKTLASGIAVVIVLGGIYVYFFTGTPDAPITASAPASIDAQQFLNLAGELQPVSFDTTLFADPRFASLVDLTVPITPESKGRVDPFAPIPGVPTAKK